MIKYTQISLLQVTDQTVSFTWILDDRLKQTGLYLKCVVREMNKEMDVKAELRIEGDIDAYCLENLRPNTIYEIKVAPVLNRQFSFSYPLVVTTLIEEKPKLMVSSEELLSKHTTESRDIFLARKAKNWQDYIRSGYKVCKPSALADERVRRNLLLGKGFELFDEYGYDMSDDYFQGPFYRSST